MSWWLFLPLAWIATGLNLVVARDVSWHNHAPDFLLLMLSFVLVRPAVERRLLQTLCLGLLMDFSGTGTAGVHAVSAILAVAMLTRWTRKESDEPASWLMWAFPAMCLCSGLAIAGMSLLSGIAEFPTDRVFAIPFIAAVTMAWGILFSICLGLLKRLIFPQERTYLKEPNSLTFFLSR